jgi:transcription termination factor Rho
VRKDKKAPQLNSVESVCGLTSEQFNKRTLYTHLIAIDPSDRFQLAATGEMSMRVVDLLAPIGKGTRGMIVSPPKAGKTTLLEQIARAIQAGDPQTRILVLLIDERPEEVTHFRRAVDAEVIASSSDRSIEEHVALAELMLAHVRTELECGRDIVLLVDSLTRMGRVFNLRGRGRGRTMSGGLDAGALEIPRRFFGLARNIENGGSVTIIATALIDTGSRMDQLIFEEFKGTGNSEIVLDRALAEARIFPAINVAASGTRKEERLYDPDHIKRLATIRRGLVDRKPKDAMTSLLNALESHPTNEEFLQSIPLAK